MQAQGAPSDAGRVHDVIAADVRNGALPAGALLPSPERVAQELVIRSTAVREAYLQLLADGLISQRADGQLYVPSRTGDEDPHVGDATQIRFEAALLRALREAAARGLSVSEATGMFKAALVRMERVSRPAPDSDEL